jgi:hypothetical protein
MHDLVVHAEHDDIVKYRCIVAFRSGIVLQFTCPARLVGDA